MITRYIISITVIIIIINSYHVDANEDNTRTYKSYIDIEFGFYRVIDITTLKPTKYEGRILTVQQGDIVTWINDEDNRSLTIISEEDLWNAKDSFLRNPRDIFSHKFEKPGKYDIYVQEDPTVRQIISVNERDESDNAIDIIPKETAQDIVEDTVVEDNITNGIYDDEINNNDSNNKSNVSTNNSLIVSVDNNDNLYKDNKDDKDSVFIFIKIFIIILMALSIRIISVLMIYGFRKILK